MNVSGSTRFVAIVMTNPSSRVSKILLARIVIPDNLTFMSIVML